MCVWVWGVWKSAMANFRSSPTSPNWPLLRLLRKARARDTPIILLFSVLLESLHIWMVSNIAESSLWNLNMENLPRNYEAHVYLKSEYGKFPKKLWNPYLSRIWIWKICQEIMKPIFGWGKLWPWCRWEYSGRRPSRKLYEADNEVCRIEGASLPPSTVLPPRAQIMPV